MKAFIKSIKKNTIFLLLITIVVLYFVLKDDFQSIVNTLNNIDIKYVIIAVLFYMLSIVIKGYVNYTIINEPNKISKKEAIKHNFITQFFNGITPFSTGGQPMEIYMINEHGISVSRATNFTIQSFIFYQIALVICGFLSVIFNYCFQMFPKNPLLRRFVLLGFIINIAVVVVLILISYSKKINSILKKVTISISKKIKKETNEKEISEKFDEFYEGFKDLKKKKEIVVQGILLNIVSLLCLYITPLFVVYSMGDFNSLNVIDTITASAYVYVIGAFVPIPGASGGIEFGFTQFFGNFIETSVLPAALLVWRFITYFLGIIIGAVLFNTEKKVEE